MMQRPIGAGEDMLWPPPREQYFANTGPTTPQHHHFLTPQFGRHVPHSPGNVNASSYGPVVSDTPKWLHLTHSQKPFTSELSMLPPFTPDLTIPPPNHQSHPDPMMQSSELAPPFLKPSTSFKPSDGNHPHHMWQPGNFSGPPHPSQPNQYPSCHPSPPWPHWILPPQHTSTPPPPTPTPVPVAEPQACPNIQEELLEGTDVKWIKEFEEQIMKQQKPQMTEVTSGSTKLKLCEVVGLVCEAEAAMRTLVTLEQQVAEAVREGGSVREAEWRHLVHRVHRTKQSLNHILSRFQDKSFVHQVKKLVDQRRMKRKRAKTIKKDIQLQKRKERKKRQEEEERIDMWRERLEQEEEQQRREAVVQCEADSVLGEVRQKQSEADRLLQVLVKVASLRQIRLKKLATHGQPVSPSADQHFAAALESLEDVVKLQMKQYQLEEQTLCVMLEATPSHKSAAIGRDVSVRHEAGLRRSVFGEERPLDTTTLEKFIQADTCIKTLARRRQDWDQYVSEARPPLASAVPLSWVVPPAHPSLAWAKYLVPNIAHQASHFT